MDGLYFLLQTFYVVYPIPSCHSYLPLNSLSHDMTVIHVELKCVIMDASPAKDWQPAQSVPRLSLKVTWDLLQLPK